jgi:hypothetical protein
VGRPGVQAITPESAIMMPDSAITMPESAITMPGIADHHAGTGDHDGLESAITFDWSRRSRSAGLRSRLLFVIVRRAAGQKMLCLPPAARNAERTPDVPRI